MTDRIWQASARLRRSGPVRFTLREWRWLRADKRSPFDNVYYCCTQKTASQWLKAVLRDPIIQNATGLTVEPYEELGLGQAHFDRPFPRHTIATHLYLSYPTYEGIPKPSSYRTFFVMRDPRDIVVSWYFSAKYSHRPMYPIPEMRRDLDGLTDDEGYRYVIRRLREWGSFDAQRSWLEAQDADMIVFSYEDLAADNEAFIDVLLDYLEIDTTDAETQLLKSRNRFEERSGGRSRGVEDLQSHYRKGVAGDWENRLSSEVLEYLADQTGDIVRVLGYD